MCNNFDLYNEYVTYYNLVVIVVLELSATIILQTPALPDITISYITIFFIFYSERVMLFFLLWLFAIIILYFTLFRII